MSHVIANDNRDTIWAAFVPQAAHFGDVIPWQGDFDALEAELVNDGRTIDGKDGRAIVMSAFRIGDGHTEGTKGRIGRFRQEALISSTWLLGLDFDTRMGEPLDIVSPLLGGDAIVYTSHSHGRFDAVAVKLRDMLAKKKKNTLQGEALAAECARLARAPRFRLLVPLARSVTPAEYRALWAWADKTCGGGSDDSCSGPMRLYYTPRRQADDAQLAPWFKRFRGAPLDPDNLPDGLTVSALLAAESATAKTPRAPLAKAEQERRRAEWDALPLDLRARGEGQVHHACAAALARAAESTERRPGLFNAACVIGRMQETGLLSDDDAAAYAETLLRLTTGRMSGDDKDLQRHLRNGLKLGRGTVPTVAQMDPSKRDAAGRRMLPIIDDDDSLALPLEDARAKVRDVIAQAVQDRGCFSVAADPGAGKTHAVIAELPDLWRGGVSVRLAVPNNTLAREVLDDVLLRSMPVMGAHEAVDFRDAVGLEPKRTAGNCKNFDAVNAGRRAGGIVGAHEVCRLCDLHPRNSENMSDCDFFADVMKAKDYRVTITTHALEVQRTTARARTVVDVAAFRKADKANGDTRYRAAAAWSPEGLELSIVEDAQGIAPPVMPEGAASAGVEAVCRQWLAQAAGAAGDGLEALRSALLASADDVVDLLVIDERPKAADEQRKVSSTDLVMWRGAGDVVIEDGPFGQLRTLMAAAAHKGAVIGAAALAQAVPAGALTVRRADLFPDMVWSHLSGQLLRDHAADAAGGAIPLALHNAPDFGALAVLEAAAARGWTGCYIGKDGALHLLQPLRIGRDGVRSTLYLDGTATREAARALLGPDCRHTRVRVALHPDSRVVRVDWSAGKNKLQADASGADAVRRRELNLEKLAAVVARFESTATAWVLHKSWIEDAQVRALLADAFEGLRVTYFGAADAVGSNRFKQCARIVLADWFVPAAAQAAAGEALAMRAAGDAGLVDTDWRAHAAHALEGAEIVQAAYRVRPAEAAREIVLLTDRGLPPGWTAAETIHADDLLAAELGLVRTLRGAGWLLRDTVAKHGPVALQCRVEQSCHSSRDSIGERQDRSTRLPNAALAAWLQSAGATALAAAAGLLRGYVRTARGGHPVPVFFTVEAPPTLAQVGGLLAGVAGAWLEWRGERLQLEDGAAQALEALGRLQPGAVTWESLAAELGTSPSTARARLRPLGVTSLVELQARWSALTAPAHVVVDAAGPDGPVVVLHGSLAWQTLERRMARQRAAAGCRPSSCWPPPAPWLLAGCL